jgi:hypothetical protein
MGKLRLKSIESIEAEYPLSRIHRTRSVTDFGCFQCVEHCLYLRRYFGPGWDPSLNTKFIYASHSLYIQSLKIILYNCVLHTCILTVTVTRSNVEFSTCVTSALRKHQILEHQIFRLGMFHQCRPAWLWQVCWPMQMPSSVFLDAHKWRGAHLHPRFPLDSCVAHKVTSTGLELSVCSYPCGHVWWREGSVNDLLLSRGAGMVECERLTCRAGISSHAMRLEMHVLGPAQPRPPEGWTPRVS